MVKLKRRQEHQEAVAVASIPLPERKGPRLGEMLAKSSSLSKDDLGKALEEQGRTAKRLGRILIERRLVDDDALAKALGKQYGLDVIDLRHHAPAPEALALVPEPTARSLRALPVSIDEGVLTIAVADPTDERITNTFPAIPDVQYRLVLAGESQIDNAINRGFRALADVGQHVEDFEVQQGPSVVTTQDRTVSQDDAPVVQVVNLMVTQALRDRASDVHIEPMNDRMRVRFRIDGAMHEVLSLPESIGPALISRLKIMAGMNIVERRRPQDGQFGMTIDGRELDVRVATTATVFGETAVLRLLDKSRSLMELGELGMPPATHELFARLVRSPFGMVICSGPTGSGKTTTLYATLAEINRAEVNVMTIEDPVEYVVPSINQIQINETAGLSFATGLKSILRQDPDIILVGEVRDVETARIAVQSALTGHLVLSSLHATDASSALVRLLDMGLESFLIASSVVAVCGQRLVRRICGSCRVVYKPEPAEIAFYKEGWGRPKDAFYRGEGCELCSGTGYRDRIGVYEVLEVTDEVRQLIIEGTTPHEVRQLALKQGMHSMRNEGIRLVSEDVTTISEIIRAIYVM